ncbi:mitochondrial carrier domain-containing protein [Pelagophyceae sp. CCMP2097]|nr:mitochondrial carrier domain-containing protein [Pelagophyceae sp. CCMP2097]
MARRSAQAGAAVRGGGAPTAAAPGAGDAAALSGGERRGVAAWSESALLALFLTALAAVFTSLVLTKGDGAAAPPLLPLREMLAGGLAAVTGEVALYPLEVLKVRRQTGSRFGGKSFGDFWSNGVVAGSCRALVYHGLRLGLFPAIKRAFSRSGTVSTALGPTMLLGAFCGAVGAMLCNPLDVAKTRLQRDASAYGNSLHALASLENPWRGATATVIRAAMGSAGQLATYDYAKRQGANIILATVASSVAYVTCAAPADVIKSRLMVDRAEDSKYTGALDCVVRTVRGEGLTALFKGWLPSLLRLLPISLYVFPLLEYLRFVLGAGAF